MVTERREDDQVRWTTLAMAGLATVALDQAMLEPGRSRAPRPGLDRRRARRAGAGRFVAQSGTMRGSRRPPDDGPAARRHTAPILALLALFALAFACEAGRLVLTGRAAMAEVTLLSALRNLGLGLAAMAHRPAYARLSALVSLFLVTVAPPVGGEGGMAVLAPAVGFAAAGTLWLMLVYWKGLGMDGRRGGRVATACRSRARPGCWRSSGRSRPSRRPALRGRPPYWRP